jgi:quercetin dioxygenase-like cupin family protein
MKRGFVVVWILGISMAAVAWADHAGTKETMATPMAPEHHAYTSETMTWVDAPPSMPKGSKMAVLQGDPVAPGLFTIRVRVPAGYRVAPHFHPADEHLTVISGELIMALGDRFDESKEHTLPPGAFSIMPKGVHHYAWTRKESEYQIHGVGPWGITYVNPEDDPRNAKQAAK